MIAAALAEQGAKVPADLQPVDVWPVAVPYRTAFRVLSASRSRTDMAPLPIAYSEIISYADANGFSGTMIERDEFVEFVQVQDDEYLSQVAKAAKAKEPPKK